jgi:hypothetical protein
MPLVPRSTPEGPCVATCLDRALSIAAQAPGRANIAKEQKYLGGRSGKLTTATNSIIALLG